MVDLAQESEIVPTNQYQASQAREACRVVQTSQNSQDSQNTVIENRFFPRPRTPGTNTSNRSPRALDPVSLRRLIVPGAGGRRVFRILIKNACRFSCTDCPMSDQNELAPEFLEPARIARLFLIAYRRGWCDGVFITSGVARTSVWAMEKTLELVETLRVTLGFQGYIHVKAAEGSEPGQVERLFRLVDRVSHHLEPRCAEAAEPETPVSSNPSVSSTPNPEVPRLVSALENGLLSAIRPTIPGLRERQGARKRIRGSAREAQSPVRRSSFKPSSEGTPPAADSKLWRRRAANEVRPERIARNHGFMARGFSGGELAFQEEGAARAGDPKLEWAIAHPEEFPIEVTTASREELHRVPGLGERSVEWILAARSHGRLSSPEHLDALGAAASRAAGFLLFKGRLVRVRIVQPTLFEAYGRATKAG